MAITQGFTDHGGEIRYNIATGYQRSEFKLSAIGEHATTHPDSCVLGLFSVDFAEWYFDDTKSIFEKGAPGAYLAPLMLEEELLSKSKFNGGKSRGVVAWSTKVNNQENNILITAFENQGKKASIFTLLGWEAGLILGALHEDVKAQWFNGVQLGEQVKQLNLMSPRGLLTFNAAWNTSVHPMYLVDVEAVMVLRLLLLQPVEQEASRTAGLQAAVLLLLQQDWQPELTPLRLPMRMDVPQHARSPLRNLCFSSNNNANQCIVQWRN